MSCEKALKYIRATRTETDLRHGARLDREDYPTGEKITAEQETILDLRQRHVSPQWNYVIAPHSLTDERQSNTSAKL